MMGHSHALLGLGAVVAVNAMRPFVPSGLLPVGGCLLLGVIGGLLPDIDARHSEISDQAGCVGWFIRLFVRHRGLTHEPALTALLLVLCWRTPYALALAIGYACHLLADGLTKEGLPFLHRWRLHLLPRRLRFTTGTFPEYAICVGTGIWLWIYAWPILLPIALKVWHG